MSEHIKDYTGRFCACGKAWLGDEHMKILTADLDAARGRVGVLSATADRAGYWMNRAQQAEQANDALRLEVGRLRDALLKYGRWNDGPYPSCPDCYCNLADDGTGHDRECELGHLLATTPQSASDAAAPGGGESVAPRYPWHPTEDDFRPEPTGDREPDARRDNFAERIEKAKAAREAGQTMRGQGDRAKAVGE